MTLRTVMRCPECAAPMSRGERYEAAGVVSVHICLEDGTEIPPFGPCCLQPRRAPGDTAPCRWCNADVVLSNDHIRQPERRVYCSVACYGNDKRREYVSPTCPCGTTFTVPASRLQNGQGVYCSKPCQLAYRPRRRMAS